MKGIEASFVLPVQHGQQHATDPDRQANDIDTRIQLAAPEMAERDF